MTNIITKEKWREKKEVGGGGRQVIVEPVLKCLHAFLVLLGKFGPGKLHLKALKM